MQQLGSTTDVLGTKHACWDESVSVVLFRVSGSYRIM